MRSESYSSLCVCVCVCVCVCEGMRACMCACNCFMGGVDRNDQVRTFYHVRLKCRKYYKYIFGFLFEVSIANAYIIFI